MSVIYMILQTAFSIVLVSIIARFLAQMSRADFYNPLAQTVVTISNPFVKPLRRIIPSVAGLDIASLIALLFGQIVFAALLVLLSGQNPLSALPQFIVWGLIASASLMLTVIKWSMVIVAVSSIILMGQHNPFIHFISQMIEPFVGPFKRLNLQVGILDLSFLLAFLAITILNDILLLQTIGTFAKFPAQLFV